MRLLKRYIAVLWAAVLLGGLLSPLHGQEVRLENGVTVDKSVHNFGDIQMSDGPVECTFTVTNGSKKPIVIYNVVTSCGCTEAKWTRNPIRPGEKGKITVTYTNDEGAYTFNKSVTAYISSNRRPVVLRLKGTSHDKPVALEEIYRLRFGPLALEKNRIMCGNMVQGQERSNVEMVANLSRHPIKIEFADVSRYLDIKVQPNPIPARSTARLHFCIASSTERWGNNDYTAVPVVDGIPRKGSDGDEALIFQAFTIEDFTGTSANDIAAAPVLDIEMSSYEFGKMKKGKPIRAFFTLKNAGKKDLIIHKIDSDMDGFSHNEIPVMHPGESFDLSVEFDTCCVPAGDWLALVTLTTNSPSRPYANLFVSGVIEY